MTWAGTAVVAGATLIQSQQASADAANERARQSRESATGREFTSAENALAREQGAQQFGATQLMTQESAQQAALLGRERTGEARERQDVLTGREQLRFDISKAEDIGRLGGFQSTGAQATEEQAALSGLRGAEAEQAAISRVSESPSQKWIRQRQQRGLLSSAAATGGVRGGRVLTQLQEQSAGFAMQDLAGRRAQLGELSGRGLTAAQAQAQIGSGPGIVSMGDVGSGISQTAPTFTAPTFTPATAGPVVPPAPSASQAPPRTGTQPHPSGFGTQTSRQRRRQRERTGR